MPSGSRFETDLQALRAARGLSLAQIQQETRIPVDVLRRFEDGELIGDPTYNEVYLRAFLKSYAKALGTSPGDVVEAYTAQQKGNYQGGLHPDYKGTPGPSRPTAPAVQASPPAEVSDRPDPDDPVKPPAPAPTPSPVAAVRSDRPAPKPSPTSSVQSTRVARPAVPGARRSYDKNWGLIIGLFVGAVAILGTLLYFLVFSGGDAVEDRIETPSSDNVASVDSAGVGAGAGVGGKRLQIPIRVTVTATGGKLQNFRVTAAPDERRGYWLEEGASETYESDSLIIIWGEGANGIGPEAMIELQGERWRPASGQVLRIDRESGQRLLDSLATVPASSATESGGA